MDPETQSGEMDNVEDQSTDRTGDAFPNDIDSVEALTEEGEARRLFLKQALIAGGGLAAANLLLKYSVHARNAANTVLAEQQTATPAAGTINVKLKINGKTYPLILQPQVTLLDALRERIGLTGSKKGCDRGQCGACTVLADGLRINSCLALAAAYEGMEITTIEGLANGEELHPVQAAFIRHDGFQCGYCTPGQIMSAVGLLKEGCPPEMSVRECMSGNICRCGAYPGIVAAIEEVRGKKA